MEGDYRATPGLCQQINLRNGEAAPMGSIEPTARRYRFFFTGTIRFSSGAAALRVK